MATQAITGAITRKAGSDLTAAQYKFVKIAADGEIDVAGAGVQAEGVLAEGVSLGRAACVNTDGEAKVVTGTGGLTAGDAVAAAADGTAVTAAGGDVVLGVAMVDSAEGAMGTVLLNKGGFATA